MRRSSLKVAPRHDRMYIIGLLACADHFTTSSQSQTHTSRSPGFFFFLRAAVWKRVCVNAPQRERENRTLLNLFQSLPG